MDDFLSESVKKKPRTEGQILANNLADKLEMLARKLRTADINSKEFWKISKEIAELVRKVGEYYS